MIVHIGYDKAGSTWLQHSVFPYVAKRFLWLPDEVLQNTWQAPNEIRGIVLREQVNELDPDATLVSSEAFCHGIERATECNMPAIIREAWGPETKILVVLRDPKTSLISRWIASVTQNHHPTRLRFEDWLRDVAIPTWIVDRLSYDRILFWYECHFSKANIHPIMLGSLGRLRGYCFNRTRVDRTGWAVWDAQRRLNGWLFRHNATTRHAWVIGAWLLHNRLFGPLFNVMHRYRWARWLAKAWLIYARRIVTASLDAWLPSRPIDIEFPDWFCERYDDIFENTAAWTEDAYGSRLTDIGAWLNVCRGT